MQARIQRWGDCLALRIPQSAIDDLGLSEDEAVEVIVRDGQLIVDPAPTPTLTELLSQITDENMHSEQDWGDRQGKEAW